MTDVKLFTCPACDAILPVYRHEVDSDMNPHTSWERVVVCGCGEEGQVLAG